MNDPQRFWLIAYDIRDRRRLVRIGRFMAKHAWRLQYSLFAGHWNRRQLDAIIKCLEELIDPVADDIRIYPIEDKPWMARLGRQALTPGWIRLVQASDTPHCDASGDDLQFEPQLIENK